MQEHTVSHDPVVQLVSGKCGIHYGYIIVVLAAMVNVASFPGHSWAISPFVDHWMHDFGLSRTGVSVQWTTATLASGCCLPAVGWLIDRFGVLWVLRGTFPLFGLTLLWLSYTRTGVELAVVVAIVRVLNADVLCLLAAACIAKWFIRHLGKAQIIMTLTLCVHGSVPGLAVSLIAWAGWRGAYRIMALVLMSLLVLPVIFVRNEPGAVGLSHDLEMDGSKRMPEEDEAGSQPVHSTASWSYGEVLRSLGFWVLAIGSVAAPCIQVATCFHMFSICTSLGLDANTAVAIFLVQTLSQAGTAIISGLFIVDQLRRPHLLFSLANGLACGAVFVLVFLNFPLLFASVFGVAMGFCVCAMGNTCARYYGTAHFGKIQGTYQFFILILPGLSPLAFGCAADSLGPVVGYRISLLVLAGYCAVSCVALVLLPRPQRTGGPDSSSVYGTDSQQCASHP